MPAIPSPQAQLPVFRTWDENIRSLVMAQKLDILPPELFTGSGAETIFQDENGVALRFLQNCGTNAIYVAIGSAASSTNFHFILAGGSAADDGLGSIVDVSKYKGSVSIYSAAAHRVAKFQANAPEKAWAP